MLVVLALSVINTITVAFIDTFFYFSAYLSQLIPQIGLEIAEQSGKNTFVIASVFLAIILLVPYLVCFFLSKKHYGWMIGALIMFSLDTLLLAIDLISTIGTDVMIVYIINMAFHVYIIFSLGAAVKNGAKRKSYEEAVAADEANASSPDEFAEILETRNITVTRKKTYAMSAIGLWILVDGKMVAQIKNGETITIPVDIREHSLAVFSEFGIASNTVSIPSDVPCQYELTAKMSSQIILAQVQ